MNPEKTTPHIIDHVPSTKELQAAASVQENPDTTEINVSLPEPQKLLDGPRQTGSYDLANGNTVVSEVTADGMKQTRLIASRPQEPRYKSAQEFYDSIGKGTEAPAEVVEPRVSRLRQFARFVVQKARQQ